VGDPVCDFFNPVYGDPIIIMRSTTETGRINLIKNTVVIPHKNISFIYVFYIPVGILYTWRYICVKRLIDILYLQVYNLNMRENKRDDIFQTALELFAEKGYDAVSPNEIVEKVGITKPTLYYFFGSKEGLFDELLKTCYGELNNVLTEHCRYEPDSENYDRDVYPSLVRVINTYFRFAEENSSFYLMVLSMGFLPPSSKSAIVADKYQQTQYHILEELFQAIAAVHHNIKGKERIYAWRFLALINAQIGFWRRGYGTLDQQTAESIVTGFMHGIFS